MGRRITVSVIVPVYNTGESVRSIVADVLAQDFTDFELLLINDGSTDTLTLSILKDIATQDGRISVINQKNQGPSGARNTGLKKAKGQYIVFADSDDSIVPNLLSVMIKSLENTDSDMVVAGISLSYYQGNLLSNIRTLKHPTQTVDNDGHNFAKRIIKSLGNDGRMYSLCTKIFVADIIKDNGLYFDEALRFGEDVLFILHYLKYVKRIHLINDALYTYRQESSTSVFSTSSLDYESRQKNWHVTQEIMSGLSGDKDFADLMIWLQTRWCISYLLIVAGSNLSSQEKIARIKEVQEKEKLPKLPNDTSLGKKRLIMQRVFHTLLSSPRLLLPVFRIMTSGRRLNRNKSAQITLGKI